MRYMRNPEDILKRLGIYEPGDINLDLIAFSLNAQVKRVVLTECEGSIIGTTAKAIISINSDAHPKRQRFSLGHELGHWVNDRGPKMPFRCDTNAMRQRENRPGDFAQHREVRANAFAADLMMPVFIWKKYCEALDVTWDSIRYVANVFNVSLTSAAIRLVEKSIYPCMIVCWDRYGKRRWFSRNSNVPENIWPIERVIHPNKYFVTSNALQIDADKWIESENSNEYTLIESVFTNGTDFIVVLWWKDEKQLLIEINNY